MTRMHQTVAFPADRQLYLELPRDVPADCVQIEVELQFLTKEISPMIKEAEEIWAHNRTHPEELREKLQKLRGSLPKTAFGMDGVS